MVCVNILPFSDTIWRQLEAERLGTTDVTRIFCGDQRYIGYCSIVTRHRILYYYRVSNRLLFALRWLFMVIFSLWHLRNKISRGFLGGEYTTHIIYGNLMILWCRVGRESLLILEIRSTKLLLSAILQFLYCTLCNTAAWNESLWCLRTSANAPNTSINEYRAIQVLGRLHLSFRL